MTTWDPNRGHRGPHAVEGEVVVRSEVLFENLRTAIENRECSGELGAVMEELIIGAVAVLDCDGALLVLLDESETPVPAASCLLQALAEPAVSALVAAVGEVIRDNRTLACPDDTLPGTAGDIGAVLVVPFPAGDRAFGALTLFRLESRRWDPEEIRAAQAYARLVRLLLKHAASVNRSETGGDWCAPLVPQQIPVRRPADASPMRGNSGR